MFTIKFQETKGKEGSLVNGAAKVGKLFYLSSFF